MNYKYIFFDHDGTLINPKTGIVKSAEYALSKFGIKETAENLLKFIGPPLNKGFQQLYGFSEEQAMQAVMYYREYYVPKGMYEAIPYTGIHQLLQRIKAAGKQLYVVTSKPTEYAETILKFHKLDGFFEEIHGCKMDLSNADKTTLINEMLTIVPHTDKKSFVMVGDKEHDIIGATNNQIDSIGVLYGYGSRDEMEKAKPTHIAQTVEDLQKYL